MIKCERCQNHGKCPIETVINAEHRNIVCHSFAEVTDEGASAKTDAVAERDDVNHPSHYETGKYECIEVMCEIFGREAVKRFCLCNAFKYIWRCKKKHKTPTKCLEKSRWYINKYLELDALPKTNAELVRGMSVDELAAQLLCQYKDGSHCIHMADGEFDCVGCTKRWLESEADKI